jgi:tRNA-specific 2-thiouridylase
MVFVTMALFYPGKRGTLNVKAIALFSGGLDSILAVRLIQEQGIDVLGLTFSTPFFGARKARAAAEPIHLPLTVLDITVEHLATLKAPRYGYGRNMNPCIDCHTLMLKKAGEKMNEWQADFIFTGEVLGQRPMSQTRQSLHVVAKNSGFEPFVLRPLSARLLPVTKPEEQGKVNRERLLDIQGRGRKRQMELARVFGIKKYSNPAGGCLLTDPEFSRRLQDLFNAAADTRIRDIELLKYGRHFRIGGGIKVIVGRNQKDNDMLLRLSEASDTVITTRDYPGPVTLVPEGCLGESLSHAVSLGVFYSDAPKDSLIAAVCRAGNAQTTFLSEAARREDADRWRI